MVSSINTNFNLTDSVSQLYTANSAAKLVKTTIDSYIKNNSDKKLSASDIINNIVDYDDNDAEKSITDILKDYTQNTSDYLKTINNAKSGLTRTDYMNAGMAGYYDAQSALQMSKSITAYSLNKIATSNLNTTTFTFNV